MFTKLSTFGNLKGLATAMTVVGVIATAVTGLVEPKLTDQKIRDEVAKVLAEKE